VTHRAYEGSCGTLLMLASNTRIAKRWAADYSLRLLGVRRLLPVSRGSNKLQRHRAIPSGGGRRRLPA